MNEHEKRALNARLRAIREELPLPMRARQDRVAVVAVALAERLGASDEDLLAIRWAAESEGIAELPELPNPSPLGLRCLALARDESPSADEAPHLAAVLDLVQPLNPGV
jgi:hypothetical protein